MTRIEGLDHVNIRTPDVPGTARFFADVLGMTITPSPGSSDPDKSVWICDAEGRAAVHVGDVSLPYPGEIDGVPVKASAPGSGRVHHVAMRCTGYDDMRRRLSDSGTAFLANDVPAAGLRQLFVSDPNELMLELNFFGD